MVPNDLFKNIVEEFIDQLLHNELDSGYLIQFFENKTLKEKEENLEKVHTQQKFFNSSIIKILEKFPSKSVRIFLEIAVNTKKGPRSGIAEKKIALSMKCLNKIVDAEHMNKSFDPTEFLICCLVNLQNDNDINREGIFERAAGNVLRNIISHFNEDIWDYYEQARLNDTYREKCQLKKWISSILTANQKTRQSQSKKNMKKQSQRKEKNIKETDQIDDNNLADIGKHEEQININEVKSLKNNVNIS